MAEAGELVRSARLIVIAGLGLCAQAVGAEARFDASTRTFRLDGGGVSYAFGIDARGALQSIYWGARLASDDTLSAATIEDLSSTDPSSSVGPQEYPAWGGAIYTEPTLKVSYADGTRNTVLRYVSHALGVNEIHVRLADVEHHVDVTLNYSIDPATGIVGRSAIITNKGRNPIRLDQASAAAWSLPVADGYRLSYLTGRWAAEWSLRQRPVTEGSTVIESRRGATGQQANPWFAVDRAGLSGEEEGPVWFGALAWSGSWRMTIDRDPRGDVRIVGGYNPFDFGYRLRPGESLETPTFFGGYSSQGMGGASRLLHRFERDSVLPKGAAARLRPVVYDSWEATGFAVDEKGQMALAEKAASLGVERFVMDDGWFGARDSDHAGLGDWTVNRRKFPNGLKPLIDRVHQLGMDFGLWVEPEMVNRDSDLFRAHPDWVIGMSDASRTELRHQLVLNLARRDVRDYVLKAIDDLVSTNDISFLKWDHNRNWSEPGWIGASAADQQKLYVEYVRNLYWIIRELRKRHPTLEIESCAGGGGRVDLGIMSLTDEVWPSDNTDPFDRLTIQDGFTHAFAPAVMMSWVTDSPNWVNGRSTSLKYRFLSSMQGGLGIGADLNKWSPEDIAEARKLVSAYKAERETIQRGDLYRLTDKADTRGRVANLYVSPDRRRAILFAFLHSSGELETAPAIMLRGLNPSARYRLRALDRSDDASAPIRSGAYWMEKGVDLPLRGDFQAEARLLEVVD